jgi:hypothetical protein
MNVYSERKILERRGRRPIRMCSRDIRLEGLGATYLSWDNRYWDYDSNWVTPNTSRTKGKSRTQFLEDYLKSKPCN